MEPLSVNQRINFLINDYQKSSQKLFAEKINVSPSAVSSLFSKRKNKPGLEMLQKIAIAYPEISLNWLLVGRGPMIQREKLQSTSEHPKQQIPLSLEELDSVIKKLRILARPRPIRVDGQSARERLLLIQSAKTQEYTLQNDLSILGQEMRMLAILEGERNAEAAKQLARYLEYNQLSLSEKLESKQGELSYYMQTASLLDHVARGTWYKVEGEPRIDLPSAGMLSYRLSVSMEVAHQLIINGKISSEFIEGQGYQVSEQAVREFLDEPRLD